MNNEGFSVAILGATGAVGEALVEILEERQFPISELHLLASERSAGKRIQFNQQLPWYFALEKHGSNQR